MRMLNSSFNEFTPVTLNLYPDHLQQQIDPLNDLIYNKVNNGVYKAGFASSQTAYEEAVNDLFDCLDQLEEKLTGKQFLFGNEITETDWRLYVTLIRFDPVYFIHFKCSRRMISSYKNLQDYLLRLANYEGIKETINFDHIMRHYYQTHPEINPLKIVPKVRFPI